MHIITCLGNPGRQYRKTRHNIGFIAGEYISNEYNIPVKQKSFSSFYGNGKINGRDVMLLIPHTFMNESGNAVRKVVDYFKAEYKNLIVVHDEIELPFGECRTKFGGGHKGHNGLRSIVEHIGTPDFNRIRFGIGRPENPNISVSDYVLSNFTGEEIKRINELMPFVVDNIVSIMDNGS